MDFWPKRSQRERIGAEVLLMHTVINPLEMFALIYVIQCLSNIQILRRLQQAKQYYNCKHLLFFWQNCQIIPYLLKNAMWSMLSCLVTTHRPLVLRFWHIVLVKSCIVVFLLESSDAEYHKSTFLTVHLYGSRLMIRSVFMKFHTVV